MAADPVTQTRVEPVRAWLLSCGHVLIGAGARGSSVTCGPCSVQASDPQAIAREAAVLAGRVFGVQGNAKRAEVLGPERIREIARHAQAIRAEQMRTATHCQRGHRFTEANTRIDVRGRRSCRACQRMTTAARRQRQRAAHVPTT